MSHATSRLNILMPKALLHWNTTPPSLQNDSLPQTPQVAAALRSFWQCPLISITLQLLLTLQWWILSRFLLLGRGTHHATASWKHGSIVFGEFNRYWKGSVLRINFLQNCTTELGLGEHANMTFKIPLRCHAVPLLHDKLQFHFRIGTLSSFTCPKTTRLAREPPSTDRSPSHCISKLPQPYYNNQPQFK